MARTPVTFVATRTGSVRNDYIVPAGKIFIFRPSSPQNGVGVPASFAINDNEVFRFQSNGGWGPGGMVAKAGDALGPGYLNPSDQFRVVLNGFLYDA